MPGRGIDEKVLMSHPDDFDIIKVTSMTSGTILQRTLYVVVAK